MNRTLLTPILSLTIGVAVTTLDLTIERIPRDSDTFRAIIAQGIGHTCPQLSQQPLGLPY